MKNKSNGEFDPAETIAARIPIGEMVIDQSYQGNLNKNLVDKIVKNWEESAAGAIILNLRDDGSYAVLDGQHRVRAAAKKGLTELPAFCYIGKSIQEEAKLFVLLNTKHQVRAMDRFRSNLLAGGMIEKNIRHALKEVGLDVAVSGPGDDKVACVGALIDLYIEQGIVAFKHVCGILQAAFHAYPDRARGYKAPAFKGLSAFLLRYPEADTTRIIDVLRKAGPTTVSGYALAQGSRGMDAAASWGRALLDLYNEGYRENSQARLGEWRSRVYTPTERAKVSDRAKKNPSFNKNIKRGQPLGRISTENHLAKESSGTE